MPLLTIDSVTVDRAEYCRYDRRADAAIGDTGRIVATVRATGTPGAFIVLTLESLPTYRLIAQALIVTDATGTEAVHTFDLEVDPPAFDADAINRAIHGRYIVRASEPGEVVTMAAESPAFRIAAVTAQHVRDHYLAGIDLRDSTRVNGTVHNLNGVTVAPTYDIERGGYPLTFDTATRTLAWRDGPPITIPPTPAAIVRADLWNATLDARIAVTVDPGALPTSAPPGSSTVDAYTMFDYAPLADADIGRAVDDAYDALATHLRVTALEPTTVTTQRLAADYPHAERRDHTPRPWRRLKSALRPQSVETGLRRVLCVHSLRGFMGETQVIAVDDHWRTLSPLNGIVSFVPSLDAGRYPAPTPMMLGGTAFGYGAAYGDRVPSFWHVAATVGLPDLHDSLGATIRQYIARLAAMDVLMLAGRGRQGAVQSESFGRDGVSLSLPYTGGQYGVYSDAIARHKEWADATLPTILRRMIGYAGVS